MKNISILGSTGSIGRNTIDVARNLQGYKIVSLAAESNIELLERQIRQFRPKIAAVYNEEKAKELKDRIKDTSTKILYGTEGLIEAATVTETDMIVMAVVGLIGLLPTLEAIKRRKNIALATKEVLVGCGEIVINAAKKNGIEIIPIDSEHSAIKQCINGDNTISKIILTASGGPFRGMSSEQLKNVTVEQALNHPTWSMGKKITVDSATLMNKGLEVIEAKWLFDIDANKIEVMVHPQSIVHSMVEFMDGSIIAQLGITDMRIPIQYALTYPEKIENNLPKLDLTKKVLSFEKPDFKTFRALKLSYDAINIGGTMPTVLNSSNEVAVKLFLNKIITFNDIINIVEECMKKHNVINKPDVDDILKSHKWAQDLVYSLVD